MSEPLRFGRFELQPLQRRLLVDGVPAELGARAFDLLLVLAERPDRLVGKAELMDRVWPGLVVQENNLAAQVSALRKVLGSELIATIPGRGYRFTGQAAAPVPPAAPASVRTNLPAQLPVLLGREAESVALRGLLERHRLVTLVGAGGVGKSLLAMHLLQDGASRHAQGVCWVELGPAAADSPLAAAVAAALGVHVGPGDAPAALAAAMAPLDLLLALDNAEHRLEEVAELVRTLLAAMPGVRLLVTSQVPLHLAGEQVLRLGPLEVPPPGVPLGQALASGAVALFVDRARARDTRFALAPADTEAAVGICRALDGLPLAIELAAARVRLLGVAGLRDAIGRQLELLSASPRREAPERQRSLRAALAWSHGLLAGREQRLFRRLAVLRGSAPLDLVQALVRGLDGDDDWDTLDALDTLVERSLVAVTTAAGDETPRYRLSEAARAFAGECLEAAGERAALLRRHAQALAARFDEAYAAYFGGAIGVAAWQHRFAADLDDARAALAWARAEGELAVAATLAATVLRLLPQALHAECMALAAECRAGLVERVDDRLQGRLWLELSVTWADSQKALAREAAERALALSDRPGGDGGDALMRYLARCRAASAAAQTGDHEAARRLLDGLQDAEDPAWPAQRLVWGAEARQVVARIGGEVAEALTWSRRLLALDHERGGDSTVPLGNLVDAQLVAGDLRGAAESGADLVAALEGTRDEYGLAFARLNLLAARLALGDLVRARQTALAAWPAARAFDLKRLAAVYLALLAALEQRPRDAALLLGYAESQLAARGESVEGNEAAAAARTRELAGAGLGATVFERLHAEGATLRDPELTALLPGGA